MKTHKCIQAVHGARRLLHTCYASDHARHESVAADRVVANAAASGPGAPKITSWCAATLADARCGCARPCRRRRAALRASSARRADRAGPPRGSRDVRAVETRARRRIDLPVMVHLDDLGGIHEPRRHLREVHHLGRRSQNWRPYAAQVGSRSSSSTCGRSGARQLVPLTAAARRAGYHERYQAPPPRW